MAGPPPGSGAGPPGGGYGGVGGSGGDVGGSGTGGEECIPEEQELCDGVDNDCDEIIDEDLGTITCGLGICQVTVDACVDGVLAPCVPGDPQQETCDGTDEDCDGTPDNGCPCLDGDVQICYTGSPQTQNVGECHDGNQTCDLAGVWGPCVGDQTPISEECDGLDNDCDPNTLDGHDDAAVGVSCDGPDSDLCEEGTTICDVNGQVVCTDVSDDTLDVCDGADDDCDPASSDGDEDPLVGVGCDGPDSDFCEEGTTACSGGSVVCGDSTGDTLEVCGNSLDDDCDGDTDEDCCADTVLDDGSFEAGAPNPFWMESSSNGYPIVCDQNCLATPQNYAHTDFWWAYLGGGDNETGQLWQTTTIPVGANTLQFWLSLPGCDDSIGGPYDFFRVYVDGAEVFMTHDDDPNCGSTTYYQKLINVATWADGSPHTIMFEIVTDGSGSTSAFVDDVSLICN